MVGYEVSSASILSGTSYTLIQSLNTGHSKVHDIDFTSDSTKMITCGDDKKFKVWDTSSWSNIHSSSDLGQDIWKCTYAYNDYFAIGLDPGPVRVYDTSYSVVSTFNPSSSGKPYGVDFK